MKKIIALVLSLLMLLLCFCSCASDNSQEDDSWYWSEELEYEIKKGFYKESHSNFDESKFDPDKVHLDYFGTYNGYHAVLNTGIGSMVVTPREVGGHLFLFGTSNIILLYKDGEFIEFHTAFEEGKISQEDIDLLYERYEESKEKYASAVNQ